MIIHAPEDTPPARALAEKLRQMGLQAVVEPTGESSRQAMRGAAAVVALWSPRSTASAAVMDDVRFARSLGPVLHARMQNSTAPMDFANEGSIDLTGWRGEDEFPAWRNLAKAVAERAGVSATPPQPQPRAAASPFFQPGAPPPQATPRAAPTAQPPRPVPPARPFTAPPPEAAPVDAPTPIPRATQPRNTVLDEDQEPRSGGGRLAVIGLVTLIVLGALGAGGYFAYSQMQGSEASAAAWEHLDKTSPAALRAFLSDNPGALRDQAQGVLTDLEQHRWTQARTTDTIEVYNGFITDFPHSEHMLEARGRIAELQSAPTTTTAIDPLTGMPTVPQDPDLVPPGTAATTTDTTTTTTTQQPIGPGGPVALTPPPNTTQPQN
ncbi:MAG: TIR domain-containing protein [Alphaproteobacteria bacterium]